MKGIVAAIVVTFALFALVGEDKRAFRFVSDKRHEQFLNELPATDDPALQAIYRKALIFYTEKEMPRAYQDSGGFTDAYSNVSANRSEPFGNANREFPWAQPFGTDEDEDIDSFKFVHLPGPIEYERVSMYRPATRGSDLVYVWYYPEGTVFGEVLRLWDSQKERWLPFELRTRTKSAGTWAPQVYRPFRTRKEYDAWLALHNAVEEKQAETAGPWRLRDIHPSPSLPLLRAKLDVLTPISPRLVRKALSLPFRPCRGQTWVDGGHAPTTKSPFHIVPKDYDAGFHEVGKSACMNCHRDTLRHIDDFDSPRDWYGRVRGSDNIFSFHIVEPSCLSTDARVVEPVLRRSLLEAGLLRRKR